MLDFRNQNTLWCSVLVETMVCLGLKDAVICPGSRSTPLTIAFAQHPRINSIPILDERSAAFFALGRAKRTEVPVVLICSSGTAGANFLPAIIEAKESGTPLIVLTADRPPELRNCHAGQTIDQIKLYGNYPNWYLELALPESKLPMLAYLRQNIVQAWQKALFPFPGVVHLNCPFREPLAPLSHQKESLLNSVEINEQKFFAHLVNPSLSSYQTNYQIDLEDLVIPDNGIIISGLKQTLQQKKYCQDIACLSEILQFPVLAEALSPLRNYAAINPYLITTYDFILRNPRQAERLQPQIIFQIGDLPTSKQLRNWLSQSKAKRYIISPKLENYDPLHQQNYHFRVDLSNFVDSIKNRAIKNEATKSNITQQKTVDIKSTYLKTWLKLDSQTRKAIAEKFQNLAKLYEGKVAWLISQNIPEKTSIFFANSMTVRNAEFFWKPNNSKVVPYFNRGANGIDGTLSTALGIAQNDMPTIMITGDLALLHDTNGFLIKNHFKGSLTIILVNNNGGGIFEVLPIAELDPPFEKYFATPQNVEFAQLCQSYDVDYFLVESWQQLVAKIKQPFESGIRLLEIKTDRKSDAQWLSQNFGYVNSGNVNSGNVNAINTARPQK